jgi:hypothetical protein
MFGDHLSVSSSFRVELDFLPVDFDRRGVRIADSGGWRRRTTS